MENKDNSVDSKKDRKQLSKSTNNNLESQISIQSTKLLDDGLKGVGYNSFQLLDILGQGTFGKVFKVKKKDMN